MEDLFVERVDLWVQPFFEISQKAHSNLSPAETRAMKWLAGVWGKAILNASRKQNNLFVLAEFPSHNSAVISQMERMKNFALQKLGNRFKPVAFTIAQTHHTRLPVVLLSGYPFKGVVFSREKQIAINAWGEHLDICPITEARLLASALAKQGISSRVVQKTGLSVSQGISLRKSIKRMRRDSRKRNRPKRLGLRR